MNYLTIEHQGKRLRVAALKHQGKIWFHWEGETHVVEVSASRKAGAGAAKTQPGVLSAPMPGKVTQVRVTKGDSVHKGQALVVMEAMKMEYTLEADRDGKITELNANVGAQVALGDVLVRVGET